MLSVVNYQMCFVCSSTQGGKRKAEGNEPNGRNAEDVATLRELKKSFCYHQKISPTIIPGGGLRETPGPALQSEFSENYYHFLQFAFLGGFTACSLLLLLLKFSFFQHVVFAGLSHVGAHLLRLRFWWEATFIQQFASCDSFIHTPLWRFKRGEWTCQVLKG